MSLMRASGEKEIEVISLLNNADQKDKKHCVRLLEHFEYNEHLCLVYECLEMNLRETLALYGRDIGLSLDGVCSYGR